MGNKKKQPNLSPEQEENLIYNLIGMGFPQNGISCLFNGKYPQSKISTMKQKQDAYNKGRNDRENEIKTEIIANYMEHYGQRAMLITSENK